VGVAGHLEIGDGVIVTAQGGVGQDVEPGKIVSGLTVHGQQTLAALDRPDQTPSGIMKRIESPRKEMRGQSPHSPINEASS
jgi:UDP-3-O-[3-hydroxymyristoyl] glucosamine N-acyltransferase